jgi:hypothetical protein
MTPPLPASATYLHSARAERVIALLDAAPPQVLVMTGACGSGRTTILCRVQALIGDQACQYVDVERMATTPERFLRAVVTASPFAAPAATVEPATPRDAADRTLAFFTTARAAGGRPATFLLDEAFEWQTFESFPGLRHSTAEFLRSLAATRNRFVLTTRYETRAARALRTLQLPFVTLEVTPLSPDEVCDELPIAALAGHARAAGGEFGLNRERLSQDIHALTGGRPAYVEALAETMVAMGGSACGDPVSALAAAMSPGGRIARQCLHTYEIRLHRARGYGALKAVLEILAEQEPLTLSEVSRRLYRTPGSTKDYLSWLEDVDLVTATAKRYRIRDPLLRLWIRLHCRTTPPGDAVLGEEVRRFALPRLPFSAPGDPRSATSTGTGKSLR